MADHLQQTPEPLAVRHEDAEGAGAFFVEREGKRLGELTYVKPGPGRAVIEHTEVSEALHGQGAGRQLIDAAVAWARASGVKFVPACPYAKKVLEGDPSFRDILA